MEADSTSMRYDSWGPLKLFNRFKDDWIVTRQAAGLFLLSTILVIASAPIFEGHVDIEKMSLWARLPLTTLVIAGIVAIFFLWIGMWRYWVRIDESKAWMKKLSFVVLLLGFWYGSCVYCLAVYLPQVLRKERGLA
jgi:hypothetical protein